MGNWIPTVVWFLDIDTVLAQCETQVIHGKHYAIAVYTARGATTTRRCAARAQFGKVEGIPR